MQPEVVCVYEAKNVLGEGPVWKEEDKSLYWCDNIACSVHRFAPASGDTKTWPMPEQIGSIVFRENGGIIAGMKSGFAFLDLDGEKIEHIVAVEPDRDNCLNDGKADRRGRYWCGTINRDLKTPNAGLYRLDPDLSCHQMESDIISSNGIAFSPDDKTMYYADTMRETVYAYDLDLNSGRIDNRRVFFNTKGLGYRVDGATVDTEGNYWCAHIHGWEVACYNPAGTLIRRIKLPVKHPTMCIFGGDNYETLYVTSATRFLQPGEAEAQPLAGALFAIHRTGAQGFAEPRFAR